MSLHNFTQAVQGFTDGYVKCMVDLDQMNLMYSRSEKRLYRVRMVSGHPKVDYLKTIDGHRDADVLTHPEKLWTLCEVPSVRQGNFGLFASVKGILLLGNDKNLYYEFNPSEDQDNFTLYRWVTELHNVHPNSEKGYFEKLSVEYNTNYKFDGDWEWCDQEKNYRSMDEWVKGRKIYRFSDDSRIKGVSSLTLDPQHFKDSTNILEQVLYSSEEDGDSVSYSDNLESDIMMEAIDHSLQFYDGAGLNEEEKQAVNRVIDGDPTKWTTFKDKLLGGLNETLEEEEVTDVEDSDDCDDDDSDYEVDEEEEEEEEEEDDNHCDMNYGYEEWNGDDYYEPEYRMDEWSGGYYTKEEFYKYYGDHSVWRSMHPKEIFVRSMVAYNAHQIHWWPSENFKTFLKMIRDSY
jgi:hypothetical protein